MTTATRVEDLAQYGNALDDFPKGLMLKQARIVVVGASSPLRDGAAGKVSADSDLMEPPRPEARTGEES